MTTTKTDKHGDNREPELLFELHLQYRAKREGVSDAEGKVGIYLGSGDGLAEGARVSGRVRWDLFENQREGVCDTHFRGVIETEDGATIAFDTLGFFRPLKGPGNKWALMGVAAFEPEDDRYAWLSTTPAFWEGQTDLETYSHEGRVYRSAG